MSKHSKSGGNSVPKSVRDQNSQQTNPNKRTPGTNIHYDKVHGHRSGQLNPNNPDSPKSDEGK